MSQINCSQCDETFFVTKRNLVLPFVCAECQGILETQKQEPQTASSTPLTSLEILEQIRLDLENPRIVTALAAQDITVDWEQIDKDIAAIKALSAPATPSDPDIDSTTELIAALELERGRETFRADQWKKSYEEMSDRNTELVKTKNDIITRREQERDMALLELGHAREDLSDLTVKQELTALANGFVMSQATKLQTIIADTKAKYDTLVKRYQLSAEISIHADHAQKRYVADLENSVAKKDREINRLTSTLEWMGSRRDYWLAQWCEKCDVVRTLDRELAVHPLRRLLRASWKYVLTWRTR